MTNQAKYYGPLLKSFCSDIKEYKNNMEISGVLLANIMSKYEESPKKYFYIGQDTYGWTDFDNMIDLCISDKEEDYIRENNKWLTPENIISYSSNKEGVFWTMVIRLHVYLHTNELINVNMIDDNQINLLNSIGWGNLNSIEIPGSLQNMGAWGKINQSHYWDIKTKSEVFDSIKLILDIYNPDTIFIFNWGDDYKFERVIKELDVEFNEKTYIQNTIATYKIKNYNTNLIRSLHPSALKWKKMSINDMIQIIKKTYDEIL